MNQATDTYNLKTVLVAPPGYVKWLNQAEQKGQTWEDCPNEQWYVWSFCNLRPQAASRVIRRELLRMAEDALGKRVETTKEAIPLLRLHGLSSTAPIIIAALDILNENRDIEWAAGLTSQLYQDRWEPGKKEYDSRWIITQFKEEAARGMGDMDMMVTGEEWGTVFRFELIKHAVADSTKEELWHSMGKGLLRSSGKFWIGMILHRDIVQDFLRELLLEIGLSPDEKTPSSQMVQAFQNGEYYPLFRSIVALGEGDLMARKTQLATRLVERVACLYS